MPGTAAAMGLRDPFDAEQAIDAQAHLMRDLLRRFDAGRADANTHVFPLLVFEVWAQRYLDP